ncbi:MAG TPA: ABC transporter ATP-binding protein, partial [Acholeplasmataceae bacterium]|nr:ABC transporter ATP-binding protein [Acholeplasmataceae bacterium]
MIKIRNVNKFFNKNKSNEIHVINNTTLEFPNTGLVCLLGPSGSGKTTLLNVVGGLDKIDSGEINFKNYKINRYKANKWDFIRNHHFGYIFQNYILLPELTVYQNLELVLKMLGLSKEEINERIDYALEAVGMIKFKKRKPTQLSGGQQQRIAIARALVKSPDVVIADEPTGNLDEKNTTQIMNIIKKISNECLVILVTHERRLAEFYGDRIIEISDGKVVSDRLNSHNNVLSTQDDLNIYLQDFVKEDVANEDVNIKYFYGEEKQKLNLNIIFKDNTFYIHSPKDNIKIKFLDRSSEIKVIDSKKPVISKQNIEEFDYHLPKLAYKSTKETSAIKFIDSLKMAFRQLASLRRSQKLLFIVMFLSTIMVTVGFINLFSASYVSENDFLYFNRNIVATTHAEYNQIESSLTENEKIIAAPDTRVVNFLNNGYFNQKKNQISLRHITEYS